MMRLTGVIEKAGADALAYSPEEKKAADNRIWIIAAVAAAVVLAGLIWWTRNKGRGGK